MTEGSVRRVRIYTRTGDKGTSSLFTGQRRPKNDPIFDCLGHTDECNAHVGLSIEYVAQHSLSQVRDTLTPLLTQIQSRLLDIGSFVATPRQIATEEQKSRTAFSVEHVHALEQWIDTIDATLPPLRQFILPGGSMASAQLHVARSVTRRLERSLIDTWSPPAEDSAPPSSTPLSLDEESAVVLKYVNRLSDFLFVAARLAATPNPDRIYQKSTPQSPQ
jgi:cob(I)alamin adenosyltransferase